MDKTKTWSRLTPLNGTVAFCGLVKCLSHHWNCRNVSLTELSMPFIRYSPTSIARLGGATATWPIKHGALLRLILHSFVYDGLKSWMQLPLLSPVVHSKIYPALVHCQKNARRSSIMLCRSPTIAKLILLRLMLGSSDGLTMQPHQHCKTKSACPMCYAKLLIWLQGLWPSWKVVRQRHRNQCYATYQQHAHAFIWCTFIDNYPFFTYQLFKPIFVNTIFSIRLAQKI